MELSKSDIKNFSRAKSASSYSDFHKQHVGAVICYGRKRVISIGWNTDKEMVMQKKYNKLRDFDIDRYKNSGHAEMWAMYRLKKTLDMKSIDKSKLSLYIWRDTKGTEALARPCVACEAALKELGIKHVYYTGNDSYIYEEFR